MSKEDQEKVKERRFPGDMEEGSGVGQSLSEVRSRVGSPRNQGDGDVSRG